jgi:insertion element IS1 protein InsB
VNQPGDVYEQEADQVAEQVMRMAVPKSTLPDDEDEAKTSLMRKQSSEPQADTGVALSSVPLVVHTVLNSGGGQPLDTSTRAFMEPCFGYDSSRVGSGANKQDMACQRLWEAIPDSHRHGHCFTDFWAAYAVVIPKEQHSAVGKETGETAHVERWNNTLRQRLARFVNMTLSFSMSVLMHEACLLHFLHRYHREQAILLK